MSSNKIFHVRAGEGGWSVETEGELSPLVFQQTKQCAVSFAKNIAKKEFLSEVKVHSPDGSRIEIEYTYGKDPLIFKVRIQNAFFEYSPLGFRTH